MNSFKLTIWILILLYIWFQKEFTHFSNIISILAYSL